MRTVAVSAFCIFASLAIALNAARALGDGGDPSAAYNFLPIEELRKKADDGDRDAEFEVANRYYLGGAGVKMSRTEAVKWFHKAAEHGQIDAEYFLGIRYKFGQGVKQDNKEALKWITKAANAGQPYAQAALGKMYYSGNGAAKDYEQAYFWLGVSHTADAQYHDKYYPGQEYEASAEGKLNQSQIEAIQKRVREWKPAGTPEQLQALSKPSSRLPTSIYELSLAAQEDDVAAYNLGTFYELGKNTEQSFRDAFKWYRLAALRGNADAQYALGRLIENGLGTQANTSVATMFYTQAANQGHKLAQQRLGLFLYHSADKRIYEEAYFWLALSNQLASDNDDHKRALSTLEKILSPEQLATARRRAAEWRPKVQKARVQHLTVSQESSGPGSNSPLKSSDCTTSDDVLLKTGDKTYSIPRKAANLYTTPGIFPNCYHKGDLPYTVTNWSFLAPGDYLLSGLPKYKLGFSYPRVGAAYVSSDISDPFELAQHSLQLAHIDYKQLPIVDGFYYWKRKSVSDAELTGNNYFEWPEMYITADSNVHSPNGYPAVFGCDPTGCWTGIWKENIRFNVTNIDVRYIPRSRWIELYKRIEDLKHELEGNSSNSESSSKEGEDRP